MHSGFVKSIISLVIISISQGFINAQNLVILDSIEIENKHIPEFAVFDKVKGNGINYLVWDYSSNDKGVLLFNYNTKKKAASLKPFKNSFIFSKNNSKHPDDAVIIKDKLVTIQESEICIFKIRRNKLVSQKRYVIKSSNDSNNDFSGIFPRNSHEVYLVNEYNFYREDKLYDNYRIAVFSLKTGIIKAFKSFDMGKGIVTTFGMGQKFDSRDEKLVMAHPTKLQFYIFNQDISIIDTVFLPKYSSINTDSVFNSCFTDSYLEETRTNPANWMETMNKKGLYLYPHIEKIGWLDNKHILISALNVDSITPTKYSFAGKRILFIYNLDNKEFLQINYEKHKKYIPISISEEFHVDKNGLMSAIWEDYSNNDELSRFLYITKFNNNSLGLEFLKSNNILPDSAYSIKGKIRKIDYCQIESILFLDLSSCLKCFSSKEMQNAYVFVLDDGNIPMITKRWHSEAIQKELNPKAVYFIDKKDFKDLQLNKIIPVNEPISTPQ